MAASALMSVLLGDGPVLMLTPSTLTMQWQIEILDKLGIPSAVWSSQAKVWIGPEGLNLQTLGTLINIDLPWNPSRLEQRLGRIKRFGQTRKQVDMLNLVYQGTLDEKIYNVLSERLKDAYDIFGSLPDTIEDEWIESEEELRERMKEYIHERDNAKNAFSVKYRDSITPNENKWEECTKVLSRVDIVKHLTEPW